MAVTWTDEQREVIEARGTDLLVSAAAGSGKTAVLVERILSLVTDPEHPADIDRLLIVTFTRAAAAEMRERIGAALEKRLAESPSDLHLQRQSALLAHAQISTIHSFCTSVIQNYCHRIDLDPGYRVVDEGELRLLQGKVMGEYLEEQYAEGTEAFLAFADAYAPGRHDRQLETLLQKVCDFARSSPDPDGLLEACAAAYAVPEGAALSEQPWMRLLLQEADRILEDAGQTALRNLQLAGRPDGPSAWQAALREDVSLVQGLHSAQGYAQKQAAFAEMAFARLSSRKAGEDEDPELREKIRASRETFKKGLNGLRESFFALTEQEIAEEMAGIRPFAAELVRLVRGYDSRLAEAKRRKNICDYADLEHFALQILLEKDENGTLRPSGAAREIAGQYAEIMIDEYQDSNYIQEALLSAVSGAGCGRHNRFMVGDIKQSIYGFRNARPELFLEKYRAYRQGDASGEGRRIDLHRNFRSRAQVLDAVNVLFRQLMTEQMGGIVYDDAAALYPGAVFPDGGAEMYGTELLLVEGEPEEGRTEKRQVIRREAGAAAARLKELLETLQVRDEQSGGLRPLRYRDCVILLRSAAGWADDFVRVLKEEGIPAYTVSREGYFSAPEVVTVLNCLRITDNPRQDIPLAAVLHSPAVGCTDRELALLRVLCPEVPLWEAVCQVTDPDGGAGLPDTEPDGILLAGKLKRFRELLDGWRREAPVLPVHELIRKILGESGFGDYAAAMPAGTQRQANLRMLTEKAVAFARTGSTGLFNFVRYIEKLQKYSVDDGEVSLYNEAEDIVRVTTIHKSKGLEYPVVFVCGLGKQFNLQDQNSAVTLHPVLGMGLPSVDTRLRLRRPSLLRQVIRMAGSRDLRSEELRILYVAMTRAREKLILMGTVKDAGKYAEAGDTLSYRQLTDARSPLEWILQAGAFIQAVRVRTVSAPSAAEAIPPAQAAEPLRETDSAGRVRDILRDAAGGVPDPDTEQILDFLARRKAFRYPFAEAAKLPAKMSVSEIKKASLEAMQEEAGERLYPEEEPVPYIPAFMKEARQEQASGAARGTIYHHVLELLDYRRLPREEEGGDGRGRRDALRTALDGILAGMAAKGQLQAAELEAVDPEDLVCFAESPLGRRMQQAALAGRLWREQPFVLDMPAKEIDKSWPEGENILVQGVIDAWFEEDGSFVLVDYKTDRVFSEDGDELAAKYRPQLALYRHALETLTGVPVKEMLLYSVALGREIRL